MKIQVRSDGVISKVSLVEMERTWTVRDVEGEGGKRKWSPRCFLSVLPGRQVDGDVYQEVRG